MLKKNVGTTDRILRALIGAGLLVGYFLNPDMAYSWLYLVGAVVGLGTALASSCPIYTIFGLRTCPAKQG